MWHTSKRVSKALVLCPSCLGNFWWHAEGSPQARTKLLASSRQRTHCAVWVGMAMKLSFLFCSIVTRDRRASSTGQAMGWEQPGDQTV